MKAGSRIPDGSYQISLRLHESNWEEQFDVPIGAGQQYSAGRSRDQGQPTHFFPRRNRFVFWVTVPKDFGNKELVWTLTMHGKTLKAYGTLRQDYFLDDMVLTSETGAIGAGVSPEIRANKPPVLEAAGDRNRTVKVGEVLMLSAHVTDDGIPKPRPRGAFLDRAAIQPERSAADSAYSGDGGQRDRTVGGLLSFTGVRRECAHQSRAA